jgi:hypothetical protein
MVFVTYTMVFIAFTMVFVTLTMVFAFLTLVFGVEAMVYGTKTLFSEAESIFCASATDLSITAKTINSIPVELPSPNVIDPSETLTLCPLQSPCCRLTS